MRSSINAFLALCFGLALCSASPAASEPNAVVAADGSGDYTTVQAAINAAPQLTSPERPWTILIRRGTYPEVVYAQREKRHVRLVGEEAAATVITADLDAKRLGPDGQPIGTFRTATFQIDADDFTVENLTIENSFGPGSQALAIRVDGDRVVFRGCRLLGHQDTVLVNRGRHYFLDCFIAGGVDFIFGGATAFFDRCELNIVGNGYITAASTPIDQPHGLIFRHCRITAADTNFKTYLGRPWRDYAATVFVSTEMSSVVRPEGWHNWNKPEREATVRYAEVGSFGPGAESAARVNWASTLDSEQAAKLTPAATLGGPDGWSHPTFQ
jgi:pectinesterase